MLSRPCERPSETGEVGEVLRGLRSIADLRPHLTAAHYSRRIPRSPTRFPILQGLLPVDRERAPAEMLAGLTLAALAIPEVMGYTDIAGMPVVTGLYTILLPVLVFAVLGSSRHLVVGADSATAAVMAAGLAGLATAKSDQYVALAGLLALMAAAMLIVARIVRLGFLADFLSRTVLIGFLTGVGIQVAMGQVGGMIGVDAPASFTIVGHEFTGSFGKLASTLSDIGEISWTTFGVAAGVLTTILVTKRIAPQIPGALIAVIGAIAASWIWDLASHGVATVGPLPSGLPRFGFPDVGWSDVGPLVGTAGSMFILILAQSAATSRAYASKYDERFDENVDLVGLGAANVATAFSGAFVVNGSPTKTQMIDDAGGKSQLAQVTTAGIVLIVLLFLTEPIQYTPKAVLAAIVFLIGLELVDVKGMRKVLAARPDEFVVAALVATTVVCIGVSQGIIVAVVFSVLAHIRRSYHPATNVMKPMGGEIWSSLPADPDERSQPGLVVYRFAGSLYYANASFFFDEVSAFAASADPPRVICIDATAIPDVDYSGGETIRQLHGELHSRGVVLAFAGAMKPVRKALERYGLIDLLGAERMYATMSDALARYRELTAPGGALHREADQPPDQSPGTGQDGGTAPTADR
jgi:SulP family sulfate permease